MTRPSANVEIRDLLRERGTGGAARAVRPHAGASVKEFDRGFTAGYRKGVIIGLQRAKGAVDEALEFNESASRIRFEIEGGARAVRRPKR